MSADPPSHERPAGGERRESARQFLVKDSPGGSTLRALTGLLLGGGSAFLLVGDRLDFVYVLWIGALGVTVACLLIFWLFPPRKVCVFVGVDGVDVWGRFIPYASIEGVRQDWQYQAAGNDGGQGAWPEADVWTIFLDLRAETPVRVESMTYERSGTDTRAPEHQNVRGADVVRAIEAGLAAWRAGHGGPAPAQEELIARGERTVPEWVEALRRLGSGATAAYRGLPVDVEGLARVLAEPMVRPSIRAAAAVALAAAGDASAVAKLRIAAAELADPRLRIALEKAADDTNDAAVVEALEALEEAERAVQTSRLA